MGIDVLAQGDYVRRDPVATFSMISSSHPASRDKPMLNTKSGVGDARDVPSARLEGVRVCI